SRRQEKIQKPQKHKGHKRGSVLLCLLCFLWLLIPWKVRRGDVLIAAHLQRKLSARSGIEFHREAWGCDLRRFSIPVHGFDLVLTISSALNDERTCVGFIEINERDRRFHVGQR